MPFNASNVIPQKAYDQVRQTAVNLKAYLERKNTELEASGADYDRLQSIAIKLIEADSVFNDLKSTAGLAAYAQDQENDPAYDVAAEFTAMQAAIAGAIAWLDANVPLSVTLGLPSTWTTSATPITNSFNSGQTNGLRTELAAVIATIN